MGKFWLSYEIVNQKITKQKGKTIDDIIKDNAIEIVVEKKMNHPDKNNPKTQFWYLLQKISDEWKIIEHYHIPDQSYPEIE